jgi:UDP-N-acetylglucosamine transferase subunit ALG13
MIFVTVGTDGPFDRLITAVDGWAQETARTDVVAQIGRSKLRPQAMRWQEFLDPLQFKEHFAAAELVIAHAGMGTILSALRYEKPLLVLPRRATLGEQRNEHQMATARRLAEMGKVNVAFDVAELLARLQNVQELTVPKDRTGPYAEPRLIDAIHEFIHAVAADAAPLERPMARQRR